MARKGEVEVPVEVSVTQEGEVLLGGSDLLTEAALLAWDRLLRVEARKLPSATRGSVSALAWDMAERFVLDGAARGAPDAVLAAQALRESRAQRTSAVLTEEEEKRLGDFLSAWEGPATLHLVERYGDLSTRSYCGAFRSRLDPGQVVPLRARPLSVHWQLCQVCREVAP